LEVGFPFVGIDVSQARLDVAVRPSGASESFLNDAGGIKDLVKRLEEIQTTLIGWKPRVVWSVG
jgi:hypothetical protein